MRQRIVWGLLLSLWLFLVGVELAEELGFFDFDDPGLAQTMDGIVNSFGQSTPIDDHQQSSNFSTSFLSKIFLFRVLSSCC